MERFLQKARKYIHDEDPIVREFIRRMIGQALQEDYFSYNGILAVRAVGSMQLTEHIEDFRHFLYVMRISY